MKSRDRVLILIGVILILGGCSNIERSRAAEYSLLKGVNLSEKGDFEGALREYNNAYKIEPKSPILLKEMAFIYYKLSNVEKAEKLWLEALRISPKDESVIKNLVVLYYEQNRYEEALKIMENSYNQKSDYYNIIRGLIAYNTENFKEALTIFEKVSPNSFDLGTYLIFLKLGKNYYNKEKLLILLKDGKHNFQNNYKYVIAYAQIMSEEFKNYENGEKFLLSYMVENGYNNEIVLTLANLYRQKGEKEKAEDTLLLLADD